MKLRFFLCVITAMTLALTLVAQTPNKNLLRGKQEIVQTGTDSAGNVSWDLKDKPAPRPRKPTPPAVAPSIYTFEPDDAKLEAGKSTTLRYSIGGDATSVTINGVEVGTVGTYDVAPQVTTTYHLIARNGSKINTADCKVEVPPINKPAPASNWWDSTGLWLLLLFLVLAGLIAYAWWQQRERQRWHERELAEIAADRNRPQQTPAPTPASVVNHFTVHVNGERQPAITTEANDAQQPVAATPEAAAVNPANGETAAQPETATVATAQDSQSDAVAQNEETK